MCVYLSDGLRDSVAAAGVCEADGGVQADLVTHRNVNWLGALIGAPQRLNIKTNVNHPSASLKTS